MTDLDRLLSEHGLLTTAEARSRGLGEHELRRAVGNGLLRRVRRGVFAAPSAWDPAPPWERFRLTVVGVLLGHPGWAASHHAALAVHGLPLVGVDLGRVDVVADVGTSKRRDGVHVHRRTVPSVEVGGLRVVPVAEACVATAAAGGLEPGLVAMDAALHSGRCDRADLGRAVAAHGARTGAERARRAVELADPAAESPGETRTRMVVASLGVPVRSQVEVHDALGFVGRVDLLVGGRVVVEFDGLTKYAGADGPHALAREKRREERLRDAGYRVVRVTWADLERPAQLLARVRAALAAAAA
ncbi:type IV toxin-antitoxin system AbiEi family antitoxin domain-containing protein [Phycicoccus sonneratiae]|uniref:Type IV toxin-antitoxin system AbiEi family antitoxin domain-containing protein n=1 Tax=Phycicoccus sonneratiae TaxID=2807628 RepID=A0ABS2CQB5_9MICO|nr:type IV toxin-antitoxin system AbiEi family antitoxin domain-containing protein [Phycicoccus sonneraticus]MBM6402066.1 type IV toxin-antitoxin system AbiEi family antitoxin domain-containing protein [Phycicoccus sonneraticus]